LQEPPLTLNDLAAIHGISRERVRQLRERGLERLRDRMGADDGMLSLA
jgi:RNA polymerase sigma-32 factor